MRLFEIIMEGGYGKGTERLQQTVLKPRVIGPALQIAQNFTNDFNQWLARRGLGPIKMGKPTGSSAHYEADASDPNRQEVIYGDIDLQMIAPAHESMSPGAFNSYWNKLEDQFIKEMQPEYLDLDPEMGSKIGHPVLKIPEGYVKIDLMWHEERYAAFGRARVTPERGLKGLLWGNLFSGLGEILGPGVSIQHAGIQLKMIGKDIVPFSNRKNVELVTVTHNPQTLFLDLFKWIAQQQGIDPKPSKSLIANPGLLDLENPQVIDLVKGIKAFAESCQRNRLYGKGLLDKFSSAEDFLNQFIAYYKQKCEAELAKTKYATAVGAGAARAANDLRNIQAGLNKVIGMFQ
jgi:hypothetical protein